jgi:hypothetical protein
MWLEANCPRKGIVRALRDGTVEHLGGFLRIPPTSHPGWIVRVTSAHGKKFIVAVIAYQNRYGMRILSEVPWRYWAGLDLRYNNVDIFKSNLMSGDDPITYNTHRLIAERKLIDEVTE